MLRIFQETINFATKQIFWASNFDSIQTSFFCFREFFLLFHFLSNPSKQITIICILHRSFPMSQKIVLLENSYRKRALDYIIWKAIFLIKMDELYLTLHRVFSKRHAGEFRGELSGSTPTTQNWKKRGIKWGRHSKWW